MTTSRREHIIQALMMKLNQNKPYQVTSNV